MSEMKNQSKMSGMGIRLSLLKGPFQNNGASPWYAEINLGTPEQLLKFSFDTGSNFIWVTSSLCDNNTCHHYGGGQFNYSKSSSFHWLSSTDQTVDFGPWGDMQVRSGNDIFTLPNIDAFTGDNVQLTSDIYLSKNYEGTQFEALDWDGGIGMPSLTTSSQNDDVNTKLFSYRNRGQKNGEESFHFLASLIATGYVNKNKAYLAFETDQSSNLGTVSMGVLNPSYKDSLEYCFLPWSEYSEPGGEYLWTTKMAEFKMGDHSLAKDILFALDTGSSQYKGAPSAMYDAFLMALLQTEDLTVILEGDDPNNKPTLTLPSSTYNVKIEEGMFQGHVIPQFRPLNGVEGLILVGSVLMDFLYTVYEYQAVEKVNEGITLIPIGMWLFNKPDGPKIIQNRQSTVASIFCS
ncbi:pepsin-like aspartic protease [Marinomonas sp. 15G1-11]|uniref:Pepsin-like aspartic protease n=1 Tax=Marinomonas phaeophyticola TaxID=3004091 RepID=A0ABT4JRH8_9GAMM|nr:pepsin-like aspartic protease [Marinomonas sp. 15G1-11]MCZ2720776.1 pepsin-like aspartic protease [Marinomonas sp. 15G1-11]